LLDKTRNDSAKKEYFSFIYLPFRQEKGMKLSSLNKLKLEVFNMDQKNKQNKVQPKKQNETKRGYGDKKLEGPDRPST
jgi:hypothetical protein